LYYLKSVLWWYKLLFFKREPLYFTVYYLVDNFFEHFDVPNSKFEWVVS